MRSHDESSESLADPELCGAEALSRRELLRWAAVGGVGLSVPSWVATSGAWAAPQADVDRLTWSLASVRTLDSPTRSFDAGSQAASILALEPLLTYDSRLRLVGALAESWSAVNPLTYVYRLRKGVRYWDGSEVTASDVVYSIKRHLDPKVGSSLGSYLAAVRSVTVTGPREVTVKLKEPDPFWRYVPTFTAVVPQEFAERAGKNFGAPGKSGSIMGTGPYVPTSFKADTSVAYARNDDYWGKKPVFRNVEIRVISDPQTRQLALRGGEIDGTFDVPVAEVRTWKGIRNVTVRSAAGVNDAFFSFDLAEKPWSDVHVRRAVAHALDKKGLVQSLLGGYADPASSMVPRAQWFGLVSPPRVRKIYDSLATYEFSLAKARSELRRSSVPGGFSATVKYRDTRPDLGKVVLSLAANLEQIGIELDVVQQPLTQEIEEVTGHKELGFRILSFTADYPDPGNYPSFLFPSAFARPNAFNVANWKNKQVDKLLRQQAATVKSDARAAAIAQIMRLASEELPYLPVWWEGTVLAIRNKFAYTGLHSFYPRQNWVQNIRPA